MPQAVHEDMTQSMGHWSSLQVRRFLTNVQLTPPWAAAVMILRAWIWEPAPQVFVQGVQADHPEGTQSMGQATVLQALVSERARQAFPPNAAAILTLRSRVWAPVPQVLVQAPKAPQAETTQSMGQAWVLQSVSSVRVGQALPPLATAVVTTLNRFLVPAPQLTEQTLQADQAETTQSTGQAWVLHSRPSWR